MIPRSLSDEREKEEKTKEKKKKRENNKKKNENQSPILIFSSSSSFLFFFPSPQAKTTASIGGEDAYEGRSLVNAPTDDVRDASESYPGIGTDGKKSADGKKQKRKRKCEEKKRSATLQRKKKKKNISSMLESSLGLSRSAPTTTTTTAPSLSRWIPPQPSRTRQCPMRVASKTLARLAASLAPSVSMSMTSTAMSSTAAKTSTPTPRRRQQVTLSSSSSSLSRSFASTAAAAAASSSSSSGASASTSRPESAQEKDRNDTPYSFVAASERGTALLASLLSRRRLPGDVLLLYGDVGAGKSAFARAFIRAAALDDELPVPSPTFLLHNVYDDDVVADGGEFF